MYLLDTNILSHLLRRQPPASFMERLKKEANQTLFTSCICVMELRHGAARLKDPGVLWRRIENEILSRIEILPVSINEALLAGDLLAHLYSVGKPIDTEDILIGATAICNGLTVVTNNVGHFKRIPNLQVEDWLVR